MCIRDRQQVGSEHVQLLDDQRVHFLREGISIDLGGIGKGYSIDRATELIESEGISDFLIHGGQSSVTARGHRAVHEEPNGWTIGISHPTVPNVRLAELYLRDQSLGTSGSARQGFFHQGKRYGHVIDPRNGWPASQFLSTTVITPTAAEADALATAFFVMSIDEVSHYCAEHPQVKAIVIFDCKESDATGTEGARSTTKGGLEIRTFNLQPDDWKQLA